MRNPLAYSLADALPEQFKVDYPKFYDLLYKFYLWLDSDDNYLVALSSMRDYLEVNNEEEFYIDLILAELGWDNSLEVKIPKKLLVATLRDFYLSRGTLWSYQYLFRVIYGKEISIDYSRNKLFKPSASTYSRDLWILTTATSFGTEAFRRISDPTAINNRIIFGAISKVKMNGSDVISTFLDGKRYLMIAVNDNYSSFTPNERVTISYDTWTITERIYNVITFNVTSPGHGYKSGDIVQVLPDEAITVTGSAKVKDVLSGSVTRVEIVDGGIGYTVGDLIRVIGDAGGKGFAASVSSVNEYGTITGVLLWSGGHNYSSVPNIEAVGSGSSAILTATSTNIGGIKSIEITEPFWGSKDTERIINVVSSSGTGAVITLSENNCINTANSSFKDSTSFLGINGILHDSWYWQEFSYQLISSVNKDEYNKLVQDLVHPVGTVCHAIYEKETFPVLNLKLIPSGSFENPNNIVVPVDTKISYETSIYLDISRETTSSATIGTLNTIDPFKFEDSFVEPITSLLTMTISDIPSVKLNWALPVEITQNTI